MTNADRNAPKPGYAYIAKGEYDDEARAAIAWLRANAPEDIRIKLRGNGPRDEHGSAYDIPLDYATHVRIYLSKQDATGRWATASPSTYDEVRSVVVAERESTSARWRARIAEERIAADRRVADTAAFHIDAGKKARERDAARIADLEREVKALKGGEEKREDYSVTDRRNAGLGVSWPITVTVTIDR